MKSPPKRRRLTATLGALTLFLGVISVALPVGIANATEPAFVSQTLEGCRNDGTITLPNGSGKFICPDSAYTTGNLGKGWNELDLVPHRLTVSLGSQSGATTAYDLNIVADYWEAGHPGYDLITLPEINTAKSDASCALSSSDQGTLVPGIGGTDKSIYRTLHITQNKGTTCVIDWAERLALGSHLYPGSSLHTNLTQTDFSTGGIGARDVSIPVKEILPQELAKTETATQGAGNVWSIEKTATPTNLDFVQTCDANNPTSQDLKIEVKVTKSVQTTGNTVITAVITATNPAHRIVDVTVTDTIYVGALGSSTVATALVGQNPKTFGITSVPAEGTATLTHVIEVAAGTATVFSDKATAKYTDHAFPTIEIPGQTEATAQATVVVNTSTSNSSVTVTDLESIAGNTDIEYRINTGSAAGTYTFNDGAKETYTPGTTGYTKRPVLWTSSPISSTTTFTFFKSVRITQPTSGDATLSDTASIVGDGGQILGTAPASVKISTSAVANLTVSKTISVVLDSNDGPVTFTFQLFAKGDDPSLVQPLDSKTITFNSGEGASAKTVKFSGLTPGEYFVHEVAPAPWAPASNNVPADLRLPTCGATVFFDNGFGPAKAAVKKITVPIGHESGWVFDLYDPSNTKIGTATTNVTGDATFAADLVDEGTYTVKEVSGPPATPSFYKSSPAGDCTFTIDFPGDAGATKTCTFTNTQKGTVKVIKTENGTSTFTHSYKFELKGGPDSVDIVKYADNSNGGILDFGELKPGSYTLCEGPLAAGFDSTLGTVDPTTGLVCVTFTLAAGEQKVFTVDNTFPQGGQRTIGYWKNWSTCSGGRQALVAEKNGFFLLDDFLGTSATKIGNLQLTTCSDAVNILSKKALDGTKHANDPLFNMSAQLLGAQLNVGAGASTCPSVTQAIADANALLLKYNFNGTYPYSPTLTSSDAAKAKQLASTLDNYNNGLTC